MTSAETSEARFYCAVCGELAGRVALLGGGEPWTDRSRPDLEALGEIDRLLRPNDGAALVVDTAFGLDSQPVLPDHVNGVAAAVAAADASALYAISFRYAPFHCSYRRGAETTVVDPTRRGIRQQP